MVYSIPSTTKVWSAEMRSLLLVEDDDILRTALRHFLADAGFYVYTARSGREALACLQSIDEPGLILLDLMMPDMDGNEFLATRRSDPRLARIPVAIMSAWTREWTGDTLGVVTVLPKPIDPEQLLPLVARYCDSNGDGDPRRRELHGPVNSEAVIRRSHSR